MSELKTVDSVEKKKKKTLLHYLLALAIILLIVYSIYMMVSQQAEIAEVEKKNQELQAKILTAQQENDEYSRILNAEDEKAYMERIAIEKYGYGYPGERRFYLTDKD